MLHDCIHAILSKQDYEQKRLVVVSIQRHGQRRKWGDKCDYSGAAGGMLLESAVYPCDKHHDQRQLEERRLHVAYMSRWSRSRRAVWAGTPARTKLESTEEHCLLLTLSSTLASARLFLLDNPRVPA